MSVSRARSIKRAAQANASNGLTNGAALAEMEEGGSLLAANGGAVELPELEATPGRPNIVALLQQICAEHADEREIGVIAAGLEPSIHPHSISGILIAHYSIKSVKCRFESDAYPSLSASHAGVWSIMHLPKQSHCYTCYILSALQKLPHSFPVATPGICNYNTCLAKVTRLVRVCLHGVVWGAGPERMVDTAVLACHAHNDTVGLTGRPYLHVSKHTFSL